MIYLLKKFYFPKYRLSTRAMLERWLGNMNQFEIEVAQNCLLPLQRSNAEVLYFQQITLFIFLFYIPFTYINLFFITKYYKKLSLHHCELRLSRG